MSTKRLRKKYRILLVDDHPIVCRGLRMLIADEPEMEVCDETGEAAEALRLVKASRPDLVIVDLALKSGHGLDLIQKIHAYDDRIRILVSSMHDESLFAARSLQAGATGYISKQEPSERLIEAIRKVLRWEVYLSERMVSRLLRPGTRDATSVTSPVSVLTDRELGVLELIGHGHSTKQIAAKLDLSVKTIEAHRAKIKTKLKLLNVSELIRYATHWVMQGD